MNAEMLVKPVLALLAAVMPWSMPAAAQQVHFGGPVRVVAAVPGR